MTTVLTPSPAAAAPGRRPGCCMPRNNPAPVAPRRPARTETARPCGGSRHRRAGGVSGKSDAAKRREQWRRRLVSNDPICKRSCAQHVEVDIGDRRLVRHRKPFGLGQSIAVLEYRGLAVPGQVGGRLACPGRRIEISRQAAGRLRAAQQPPRLRLADGDVARREVGQHRGARQRRLAAGRVRHPDILADFGMHDEVAQIGGREQQVGAERD